MNSVQFENQALEKAYFKFKKDWDENNVIQVLSSGSTGQPKNIIISKQQMVLSASKTIEFFKLEKGLKALICLSLETIAGKMMLARSLVGNWKVKIVEPGSNPLKNLSEKIDFIALVPMQLERILHDSPEKLNSINTVIVGGAPISNSIVKQLIALKINVFQTFGMTETVSHFALRKVGFEMETFYRTIKGVLVSSLNGNLVIHYPEMFEKPLLTNDVVRIHSPETFEWMGRSDFILNSGGIKLNPERIEHKLAEHIDARFFVAGLPDAVLGEKLALIIENSTDFVPVKSRFAKVLDKYEIPKVYCKINHFIQTESGKVNRLQTIQKIQPNEWKELV
jgi:O-succinylbenzoic acid--CoA ligase